MIPERPSGQHFGPTWMSQEVSKEVIPMNRDECMWLIDSQKNSQPCDIGGSDLEPGMMYFPTKGGA